MEKSNDNNALTQLDGLYCKATLEGDAGRVHAFLKRGGDIQKASQIHLLVIVAGRGHLYNEDWNLRRNWPSDSEFIRKQWVGKLFDCLFHSVMRSK